MHPLDQAHIHFSESQLTLLNVLLAFLMFSVALDLRIQDFRYVFKKPRAFFVGLSSQWILLPLTTLVIIWIGKPYVGIAAGMLLVASCPGGNVSNYAVHLSRGNTALSIAMTSTVTILAMVMTPLLFQIGQEVIFTDHSTNTVLRVPYLKMVLNILTIIFLPLILGMIASVRYPVFVQSVKKGIKTTAFVLFILFVLVVLFLKRDLLFDYFDQIFLWVGLHNAIALLIGFSWAKTSGLQAPEIKAVTIETGIQNSGLALILIFNFFDGAGAMALIAACWGVWHLISGFLLAMLLRKW